MSDRGIGHCRRCHGEQRDIGLNTRILDKGIGRDGGTNEQGRALVDNRAHLIDLADVDDERRVAQPKPENRNQRLATGDNFDVVATGYESSHRLVDGRGSHVVKCGRNHAAPPFCAA
ncbi:unannotated protein [freshwater metagenome]|uniref:Unannotated protein n=1 Tax=freshwater metagenome TaxID=449393 RepID=A0A6J7C3R1_9ZZZZ